jgi:tripartite-type tricarboxylate transporter receptor subunit TctC
MIEAGFKDFEFSGWLGVLGPAGLPKSVADTLVDANRRILADPAFRKEMAASGYGIPQSTPEGLAARIESEGRMFVELAKRANLAQE